METVKGFRDITGSEAEIREEVKKLLVETFKRYGYESVETPIIEQEEFVKKSGDANDEAISDVYTLKDRGERKLALRYEFTFQLKRLMVNKKLPYKRYQIGEVFRDEPTTSGKQRYRQFTQCDADIVSSTIKDEADLFGLVCEVLDKLGIKYEVSINTRKLLNEILDQYKIDDKTKPYVLREIDKLDKFPESEVVKNLKTMKAQDVLKTLNGNESTFKIFKSYTDIIELKKLCDIYGIKFKFSPTLARGLSYYNGTVFEIKTLDKDFKETICAGGAYLVNGIQSFGVSFGLDRLCSLVDEKTFDKVKSKIMVISIGQEKEAINLVKKLREKGNRVELMYDKVSKALDYSNSKKFDKVIFVGEEEVKKKKFKIKDMVSGKEIWKSEKDLMK
ncbi:hypothetical protein COU57_02735 [Candidatus Pacearchaeota archaeon CG10_big_fil_rev_8_21_14_0_10_32_14]|nr:MAG: hypothetical protein COU57_02735 [Candidatus Pacearchaeota archaeon CG10_big_fil_rev_8_21_14_0_10_32_14]